MREEIGRKTFTTVSVEEMSSKNDTNNRCECKHKHQQKLYSGKWIKALLNLKPPSASFPVCFPYFSFRIHCNQTICCWKHKLSCMFRSLEPSKKKVVLFTMCHSSVAAGICYAEVVMGDYLYAWMHTFSQHKAWFFPSWAGEGRSHPPPIFIPLLHILVPVISTILEHYLS